MDGICHGAKVVFYAILVGISPILIHILSQYHLYTQVSNCTCKYSNLRIQ